MHRRLRILFSSILFLYQSALDVYREDLFMALSQYVAGLHTDLSHMFVTQELFLLIFIIHRSIIHGFIIYLLTGKGIIWKYYVLVDLTLLLLAYSLKITNEHIFEISDFLEYLNNVVFFKMLNTPILLLFFLPAYFLLKKGANVKTF